MQDEKAEEKQILAAVGANLFLKANMLSIQALEPLLILKTILHGNETPDEPIEPKEPVAHITHKSESV